MGKFIVVKEDAVTGTDKHNVSGLNTPPPSPPVTSAWIGDFDYVGKMTDQLSDFVKAGGKSIALKTSKSSLNPGETTPGGGHFPLKGSNYKPTSPAPNLPLVNITDPIGDGIPNSGAGSAFVTVDGTAVLLDGDKIDTCDGLGAKGNSTVAATGQDFVSCSE